MKKPTKASKIVHILEAQRGWRFVTWNPKSGSVIAITPVALWALLDNGKAVGLVAGPNGLEDGMSYEDTKLEFHPPEKEDHVLVGEPPGVLVKPKK